MHPCTHKHTRLFCFHSLLLTFHPQFSLPTPQSILKNVERLSQTPSKFASAFPRSSWGGIPKIDHQKLCVPFPKCGHDLREVHCAWVTTLSPRLARVIDSPNQSLWVTTQACPSQFTLLNFISWSHIRKIVEAVIVFQVTLTSSMREAESCGHKHPYRIRLPGLGIPAWPLPTCVTGDR